MSSLRAGEGKATFSRLAQSITSKSGPQSDHLYYNQYLRQVSRVLPHERRHGFENNAQSQPSYSCQPRSVKCHSRAHVHPHAGLQQRGVDGNVKTARGHHCHAQHGYLNGACHLYSSASTRQMRSQHRDRTHATLTTRHFTTTTSCNRATPLPSKRPPVARPGLAPRGGKAIVEQEEDLTFETRKADVDIGMAQLENSSRREHQAELERQRLQELAILRARAPKYRSLELEASEIFRADVYAMPAHDINALANLIHLPALRMWSQRVLELKNELDMLYSKSDVFSLPSAIDAIRYAVYLPALHQWVEKVRETKIDLDQHTASEVYGLTKFTLRAQLATTIQETLNDSISYLDEEIMLIKHHQHWRNSAHFALLHSLQAQVELVHDRIVVLKHETNVLRYTVAWIKWRKRQIMYQVAESYLMTNWLKGSEKTGLSTTNTVVKSLRQQSLKLLDLLPEFSADLLGPSARPPFDWTRVRRLPLEERVYLVEIRAVMRALLFDNYNDVALLAHKWRSHNLASQTALRFPEASQHYLLHVHMETPESEPLQNPQYWLDHSKAFSPTHDQAGVLALRQQSFLAAIDRSRRDLSDLKRLQLDIFSRGRMLSNPDLSSPLQTQVLLSMYPFREVADAVGDLDTILHNAHDLLKAINNADSPAYQARLHNTAEKLSGLARYTRKERRSLLSNLDQLNLSLIAHNLTRMESEPYSPSPKIMQALECTAKQESFKIFLLTLFATENRTQNEIGLTSRVISPQALVHMITSFRSFDALWEIPVQYIITIRAATKAIQQISTSSVLGLDVIWSQGSSQIEYIVLATAVKAYVFEVASSASMSRVATILANPQVLKVVHRQTQIEAALNSHGYTLRSVIDTIPKRDVLLSKQGSGKRYFKNGLSFEPTLPEDWADNITTFRTITGLASNAVITLMTFLNVANESTVTRLSQLWPDTRFQQDWSHCIKGYREIVLEFQRASKDPTLGPVQWDDSVTSQSQTWPAKYINTYHPDDTSHASDLTTLTYAEIERLLSAPKALASDHRLCSWVRTHLKTFTDRQDLAAYLLYTQYAVDVATIARMLGMSGPDHAIRRVARAIGTHKKVELGLATARLGLHQFDIRPIPRDTINDRTSSTTTREKLPSHSPPRYFDLDEDYDSIIQPSISYTMPRKSEEDEMAVTEIAERALRMHWNPEYELQKRKERRLQALREQTFRDFVDDDEYIKPTSEDEQYFQKPEHFPTASEEATTESGPRRSISSSPIRPLQVLYSPSRKDLVKNEKGRSSSTESQGQTADKTLLREPAKMDASELKAGQDKDKTTSSASNGSIDIPESNLMTDDTGFTSPFFSFMQEDTKATQRGQEKSGRDEEMSKSNDTQKNYDIAPPKSLSWFQRVKDFVVGESAHESDKQSYKSKEGEEKLAEQLCGSKSLKSDVLKEKIAQRRLNRAARAARRARHQGTSRSRFQKKPRGT